MDLHKHIAVLRRFRHIIAFSLLLATLLAALSLFRISPGGDPAVEFRDKPLWASTSMIYITQPGFPEGRILAGGEAPAGAPATSETKQPRFADPGRFSGLAVTYSYLLMSEELRAKIGPLPDGAELTNSAVAEGIGSNKEFMPLISIEARAYDPADAKSINGKAVDVLLDFVAARQAEAGIPERERVQLTVITPPTEPAVAVKRSYTIAIVLWLLCALLGVGLAYLLENLRPGTPDIGGFDDAGSHFDPETDGHGTDDLDTASLDAWALGLPTQSKQSQHERSLGER